MVWDQILTGVILVIGFFIIFLIGKVVNDLIHREYKLTLELVHRDNSALALAVIGYYAGLVLTIGGSIIGPSHGIVNDLIDLAVYGLLGIVLLNVSWYVCDKIILYRFNLGVELVRDQNLGSGAVSAGVSIASGFIIFGSIQGEGGNIWTVLVFWAIGQFILVIASWLYNFITSYDIHEQIEKDNVPAGVSFAGALIAVGIVIGLSGESHFVSWSESIGGYILYSVIGLIMLPLIRILTDWLLLPGAKFSDEIAAQEKPNLGAGFLEAFSYIAAAFIIYWCV